MSLLLETRNLSVQLGSRQICRELSLQLSAGERLVILGRNGAGKSTLLSTLAGLRPSSGGQVLLQGKSYEELGARSAALQRGWLGQHQDNAFASSVLETVLTGRHPHLGRWQWEGPEENRIARQALEDVGLQGFAERDVQTLSGGERQRLAIATLLTQQAPLMLLDEPLTHLDLNHQIAVLELLAQQARAGTALIMVLHDPGLAWRYGDRALLMYGDGQIELGDCSQLLTAERLSRLYGHPLLQMEQDGRLAFIPA